MSKRRSQAQLAGDILYGVAESLTNTGRMPPYAVLIGLMAATENFFKAMIFIAGNQFGDKGRASAIAAVRAGLESMLETLTKIEQTPTSAAHPTTPKHQLN